MTLEHDQKQYIEEQLDKQVICSIKDKHSARIEDISTPAIRNILKHKYISGSDMYAVLNMFETLLLTAGKREKGLVNPSKAIERWMTKLEKLNVASNQGYVFLSNLFDSDVKVVIKVPQKNHGFDALIREYFLGIFAINKLRYQIPNFVYTFGGFLCPQPLIRKNNCRIGEKGTKTAFVLYEYLSGETVTDLLKSNQLCFETWLISFVQLLLALEVAQREIRFSHFDLHGGNVMLTDQQTSYEIPLDFATYKINNPPVTPVVIDFGHSCAQVNGKNIGSFDFPNYGMMNYMVQGYDMYKFLVYSGYYAKDPLVKAKIQRIFYFYGQNDPYRILFDPKGLNNAVKTYCTDASFSKISTYTPLMFVKWIMSKQEYTSVLKPYISVEPRQKYISLHYSENINAYDDIFNYNSEGRLRALQIAEDCIEKTPSYILASYTINILQKYNQHLNNKTIQRRVAKLSRMLTNDFLIVDNTVLEDVFDIQCPSQKELENLARSVLSVKIDDNLQKKREAISELNDLVFYEQLAPYLQQYFTIMELGLYDQFKDWVDRFRSSDIFLFCQKNDITIERMIRWGQTLISNL